MFLLYTLIYSIMYKNIWQIKESESESSVFVFVFDIF